MLTGRITAKVGRVRILRTAVITEKRTKHLMLSDPNTKKNKSTVTTPASRTPPNSGHVHDEKIVPHELIDVAAPSADRAD